MRDFLKRSQIKILIVNNVTINVNLVLILDLVYLVLGFKEIIFQMDNVYVMKDFLTQIKMIRIVKNVVIGVKVVLMVKNVKFAKDYLETNLKWVHVTVIQVISMIK
jgi:hypothetical protein